VDADLVRALRSRDQRAAESLIAKYRGRACRLAGRITGNPQDAEDIVQEAFWTVVCKIDMFRGDSAFGSWLYRIVANAAYLHLRRLRRHHELPLDDAPARIDGHGESAVELSAQVDDVSATELRLVLTSAINELPADYRAALVMRDVDGLSNREIGGVLKMTVASVKSRVHRARCVVRKRLATNVSGPHAVGCLA
jgi:RNA polymerase sigma-70 factor, ECF subfamily